MLPKYKRSAKLDIPNSAKGPRSASQKKTISSHFDNAEGLKNYLVDILKWAKGLSVC